MKKPAKTFRRDSIVAQLMAQTPKPPESDTIFKTPDAPSGEALLHRMADLPSGMKKSGLKAAAASR